MQFPLSLAFRNQIILIICNESCHSAYIQLNALNMDLSHYHTLSQWIEQMRTDFYYLFAAMEL